MKHVDKYTALHLEEWKGEYFVVQGYSKDEEFRPSWVTEEWGKEKEPKKMPKRIKIGDKAKAIQVAVWMYRELTGKDIEESPF